MALPAQGIPCRIPGLQPPEGGTDWDLLAAAMMTDLITNKLLLAMFKVRRDQGRTILQHNDHCLNLNGETYFLHSLKF